MSLAMPDLSLTRLTALFGERLQKDAPLARVTSARVGGPADALLEVHSADELAEAVARLWELEIPYVILGGGSNVLVSDAGVRGVVVLNRANRIEFAEQEDPPSVWAESGANFGLIARKAAALGLSGLEWAAGIPGTLGGAIIGNAGAHGGDLAGSLIVAKILHLYTQEQVGSDQKVVQSVREEWTAAQMAYEYRSSILKRERQPAVILAGRLRLTRSMPEAVQAVMSARTEQRRRTQPPGASMGSMFKNPPGDYAGRLIEACGLKGRRVGEAEISSVHANFFVNRGQATAADVDQLIQMAQTAVFQKFGIRLELEIERIGDW